MSLVKIVKSESKKIDASNMDKAVFEIENSRKIRKQNFSYFFWGFIEFLKLLGRNAQNRMNYTVCMDKKEDSVYTFRVCNDRIRGIMCYDSKDKLKIIRIKDIEYLICPKAPRAYSDEDFDRFRIDK